MQWNYKPVYYYCAWFLVVLLAYVTIRFLLNLLYHIVNIENKAYFSHSELFVPKFNLKSSKLFLHLMAIGTVA